MEAPALLIAPRALECQVYVNGTKGGDCSQLSGPNDSVQRGILVRVPVSGDGAPVQLAIRLVHPNFVRAGGSGAKSNGSNRRLGLGTGNVLFGSATQLADRRAAFDAANFYDLLPQALICVGELLAGAILLLVFAYDRRSREYLWFAAFLWLDGSCSLISVFERVYPILPPLGHLAADLIGVISRYVPLIEFLAAFTAVRIRWWVRLYEALLIVLPLGLLVQASYAATHPWQAFIGTPETLLSAQMPFVVGSLVFLMVRWRRGNREAALLLPSFLLANGIEILGLSVPSFPGRFHLGHFGFDFDDMSMFFFLVSIGPVVLFRHRRISLEHARTAAELNAAREIQQQLVPRALPALPGYHIDAAYLPAQEVGGDFYQVLPQPDGSAIIALGDVSGKGLKAAMTGALTIGALRTLATEGLGPAALLARLNEELVRAQASGFVTCLSGVLSPEGQLRWANAGHLAPYLNGIEVPSPGSLPLGLAANNVYLEHTVALKPGDRLTLLSDGVVEAQNAAGELFGFERMAAISRGEADFIARAAQQFGQTDDITVFSLTWVELGTRPSGIFADAFETAISGLPA